MTVAGRPERMKQVNEALVREALRLRRSAAKPDIASDTGLSAVTVGQILARMEERAQIRRLGFQESSGGRPAVLYELNADAGRGYALALEQDRIDWAVCDALGSIIFQGRQEIRREPVEDALDLACRLQTQLEDRPHGSASVLALGIPGAVKDGRIINGILAESHVGKDLREIAGLRTGGPVVLENDLNAAALGFLRQAEEDGTGVRSLAYIYFTEDCVGSGLINEGRIITGASHFAGELRHLPVGNGKDLEAALGSARTEKAYVDTVRDVLIAVNCFLNPSLIVIGGAAFRFQLSEALAARFAEAVPEDVRPTLTFVRDIVPHYLKGLAGLAAEALFPAYRLTHERIAL